MATPWDADTYDVTSAPQQSWAADVLARLDGIPPDATVLDVGCGTGRVTEQLLAFVPRGRVLAIDASADMVATAQERLGDRAEVWCQDALELAVPQPVGRDRLDGGASLGSRSRAHVAAARTRASTGRNA